MNGHGGKRAGAGRPKGRVSNEVADIKALVVGALQDVGGRQWLADRAIDHPVAFMGLLGRVLPLQVTGENGNALVVDIRWADAAPQQLNGHSAPPMIEADETMIVSFETTDERTT